MFSFCSSCVSHMMTNLVVEEKTKEEAAKVLYRMKERFTSIFNHDTDSMPRVWTGKEDIRAITKTARSSSLKLLSVLAAIRLDEDTDTIGDTLVDPKKDTSKSTSDPLASSTWDEVSCAIMAYIFLFLHEYLDFISKL